MIRIVILISMTTLQLSRTQLRILEGKTLSTDKRYVAYFLKASKSEKIYDAWMCGGAIVTVQHIITSAACIEDVKRMYAIAGYDKYVPSADIDKDPCTSVSKKQVIQTCYPKIYSFEYEKASKWSNADIGIARIKGQFDFNTRIDKCSYAPGAIAINYHSNWQAERMHALVFGWGHNDTFRNEEDTKDYNSETLKFAKVKIVNKQQCIDAYKNVDNLTEVIRKFMICTHGTGRMNETGDFEGSESFERDADQTDGCELRATNGRCLKLRQGLGSEPRLNARHEYDELLGATSNSKLESESPGSHPAPGLDPGPDLGPVPGTDPEPVPGPIPGSDTASVPAEETRIVGRSGICQNDHGSPLVTYAGRAERLIGIASVFLIDPEDRKCKGPFLYTSTFCHQQFLRCFFANNSNSAHLRRNEDPEARFDEQYLDMPEEESRRFYIDFCLQPPALRGFDILERTITWSTNDYDDDSEKNDLDKQTSAKPSTKSLASARPHVRRTVRPRTRSPIRLTVRSSVLSPVRPPVRSRTRPHKSPEQLTTIFRYSFLHRHQIPLKNFA